MEHFILQFTSKGKKKLDECWPFMLQELDSSQMVGNMTIHHQRLHILLANDISIFGKDWWSTLPVGFNTAYQLEM